MGLCDDVRTHAARVTREARSVRVDDAAIDRLAARARTMPEPSLDPESHVLDGPPDAVARGLLIVDAVNFGSGWFPTLRKARGPDGRPLSGYFTVARGLAARFRADGPWTNAELRVLRTEEVADVLGQRRDHELMALYAQALRDLGRFLGERDVLGLVASAGGSAERLATMLARGMTAFADRGFYKRAQIVPSDLALAGLATFHDLDRLTLFADNLVPHVLRCAGVLVYDDDLAAWIDAERLMPPGRWETEIRGCAVEAVERLSARTGVAPRTLAAWLWQEGQAPAMTARPRHRRRCVYY